MVGQYAIRFYVMLCFAIAIANANVYNNATNATVDVDAEVGVILMIMLCYAMLCYTILFLFCHQTLCYTMLCYVTLYYVILQYAMLA